MKINIVYYSASGNTQMIADSIFEAVEDLGIEGSNDFVSDVTAESVIDADVLFLGSPAMNDENVEEYEFRPFFDELLPMLSGKRIVLFGSYDWGEGVWIENWEQEIVGAGGIVERKFAYQWEPTEEQLKEAYEETKTVLSM
ncbi:flavodoxin domain-containing protein [Erysipelothrix rhusiopathiae]|nr:flavodoxin domain-containing protein [Erysipelothrix rhusiopathiae]MDE8220664.1 flavodoxin domain-containing protein [Erysipelothrix rhusiopathiae]MDE8227300.1 flavodoxin domain-containing protein [Erysipelothrix rhusiopathiae]